DDADKIAKENKVLQGKLTSADQRVKDLEKQVADASAASADLKKTRAELADAKSQAEAGKKAATKADELTKQNKDLTGKLSAADDRVGDLEKKVAAIPANAKE